MLSEMIYMKADENYTNIFLMTGKKILTSRQLKCYDNDLYKLQFYRINRSYLVNVNHIKEIYFKDNPRVVMTNDIVVNIPRRRKSEIKKVFDEKFLRIR